YSLAHLAYRDGDPVVPPLALVYPDDPNVQGVADEKLLGRDLLLAALPEYGVTTRAVYLPAGEWVDYASGERPSGAGGAHGGPGTGQGGSRLPLFARSGAILPEMFVDDQTMNAVGRRLDGSSRDELVVRVFAAPTATSFTLFEDDGETTAYQQGAV